jgi:hypothetical protein
MKLSRHFARAIAVLFVVLVAGLEMPGQPPPPCSINITNVSCVSVTSGGSNVAYYTANAVVTGIPGCPNQTLTITPGTGAISVNPGTISPVSSGSQISFAFTASGTTASFGFNMTGCGTTCNGSVPPTSLPGQCSHGCMSLSMVNLTCVKTDINVCIYAFTMNVISSVAGTVTLASSTPGASFGPSSFPVGVGVTTISGTLFVLCGTTVVTLSGTTTVPPACSSAPLHVTLPCCITANARDPELCLGGWTQIDLNPVPPSGSAITWYKATAACPSLLPQGTQNNGWTGPFVGGPTWSTMALAQTTCYVAVISGPGCNTVSNIVTVKVDDPCSGSIMSSIAAGTPICSGTVVNLSFSASPGCTVQWQKSIDGGTPQSLGSGLTLPPQTLSTAKCPFSVFQFQATCTCGVCPPVSTSISFPVYGPPSVGTLTAQFLTRCAGDDDVLALSSHCGDIQWLSATHQPPGLLPIISATSFPTWNTNQLFQDTWFQVSVQNGPCQAAAVVSNWIKVTVNHPPTNVVVTPAGPLTVCAPHPVTLTVNMQSTLPATCKWYLDGNPIAVGHTFNATQTGEYCAVCSNACGSTKSNCVCLVEDKPVVTIQGPCATRGGPNGCITLTAGLAGCSGGGCLGSPSCGLSSYHWSASSGPPPTPNNTNTVSVCPTSLTTMYTVTVTDSCGCTATATHVVTICKANLCSIPPPNRGRSSLPATVAAAQASRWSCKFSQILSDPQYLTGIACTRKSPAYRGVTLNPRAFFPIVFRLSKAMSSVDGG